MVMGSPVVSFFFKKQNHQVPGIGNFQVETLIQIALPGSFEVSLSLIYKNGLHDWVTLAKNWQKCRESEKSSCRPFKKPVSSMDGKSNLDNTCSSSSLASRSHPSSVCTIASCSKLPPVHTMEEKSGPALVYHRRKPQMKSIFVSPAQDSARLSDDSRSNISSEAPSRTAEEVQMGSEVDVEKEAFNTSSESDNGRFGAETDLCCVNDSYSSSKSNMELRSTPLRTEADENGECSSSTALVVEGLHDNLSERDICISILRSQWLADGLWPFKVQSFNELGVTTASCSCIRTCKVCKIQERSLEMLICDECDDAFHLSCCNPRVRKIPFDEWFCYFCLKKKRIILNKITTDNMRYNSGEVSRSEGAISEEEFSLIEKMLIGIGPYKPGVRIGQEFQADVPDWSGPSLDEVYVIDEPAEIDPSEFVCSHGQNGSNLFRINSIGNWVQCRQVIEGIGGDVDGTICGKWRRAPLFEVQTDDWECFRSVLWDPAHADCAVPQELETDQVLKQLKYIEMLRPRLTAKKRKLDQGKGVRLRENSGDMKRVQTH